MDLNLSSHAHNNITINLHNIVVICYINKCLFCVYIWTQIPLKSSLLKPCAPHPLNLCVLFIQRDKRLLGVKRLDLDAQKSRVKRTQGEALQTVRQNQNQLSTHKLLMLSLLSCHENSASSFRIWLIIRAQCMYSLATSRAAPISTKTKCHTIHWLPN